jgi:hypothetical protein
MGCFQRCAINGGDPAQCQANCCGGNNNCVQWTSCVSTNCSAQCF